MLLVLNRYWLLLAGVLAFMTAGVAVYIVLSKPVHLRVAVGPQGGTDANIMIALDRILETERVSVRLDLVTTPGAHQNLDLLEKRDVDLAVLRADGPLPAGAGVVAVLRNNVVVIAAPARHKLEHIPDLKGKRLGLVARTTRDEEAVARLLDVFDLKPADVALTLVKPEEVGALTKGGRIHAVLVIGAPADPDVSAIVYSVDAKPKEPPTLLAVDIGEFLKENTASVSEATISKRAFSRRNIPEEEVDTVGIPTLLVANKAPIRPIKAKLYNDAITELTKTLLQRHGDIARKVPLASLIAAPDNEKSAKFPVHPGTFAYLEDTDVSWYTMFSDQIWNVVLVGGIASSIFAATVSYIKSRRLDPMKELLDRLKGVIQRAQTTSDRNVYPALSEDLSNIGIEIASLGFERESSSEQIVALHFAYDAACRAVDAIRR